jgi:hypothetical protein
MTLLTDLANETIQHIMQLIGDQQSLYAVCLTSRRLREAALPSLYETISLHSKKSQVAFAISLKNHPELRAYVKDLDTEYWDQDDWDEDSQEGAEDGCDDEMHEGEHELKPSSSIGVCDIQDEITDSTRVTKVTMLDLLGLMPNLESASFCPCHSTSLFELFSSRDSPGSFVAGVRNLTALSLTWWDTEGGFTLNDIFTCLALPGLREFSVHMVGEGEWDEDEDGDDSEDHETKGRGTSTVTDLSLEYWTSCSDRSLADVLRMPRGLKSLTFSSARVDGEPFTPSAVLRGLEGSRDTLEVLNITNEPDCTAFTSLADFTALKSLEIQLSMLAVGPSIAPLPDSLQSLTLIGGLENAQGDAFVKMLETRPPPELNNLHIYDHKLTTEDTNLALQARLREACRNNEVDCIVYY